MKKYYISKEKKQEGPFSIDELKEMGLKKSTLVWVEGLEDWVEAGQIEELTEIICQVPPPLPKTKNNNNTIVANEIKFNIRFLLYSLCLTIVFYLIYSFVVCGGFLALKYKQESDHCYFYSDKEVYSLNRNIIKLGYKQNTLSMYDSSSDDYPKENLKKGLIFSSCVYVPAHRESYSREFGYYYSPPHYEYSFVEVNRTLENTISEAFGLKTIIKSIYFYLIVFLGGTLGRYSFFSIKKFRKWVDENSTKKV